MASSLNVDIKVDSSKVLAALALLPKESKKELRVSVGNEMVRVQKQAAKVHRYKTRSGNAAKSMEVEVSPDGHVGSVKVTTVPAPYARRLHEGGKGLKDKLGRRMTNRPDPYLDNAFDRRIPDIEKAFAKGIENAIRSAGF